MSIPFQILRVIIFSVIVRYCPMLGYYCYRQVEIYISKTMEGLITCSFKMVLSGILCRYITPLRGNIVMAVTIREYYYNFYFCNNGDALHSLCRLCGGESCPGWGQFSVFYIMGLGEWPECYVRRLHNERSRMGLVYRSHICRGFENG